MTYIKVLGLAQDENGNPAYAGMTLNLPPELGIPFAAGFLHKKESEIEVISEEEYFRDYGDEDEDEDEEEDEEEE